MPSALLCLALVIAPLVDAANSIRTEVVQQVPVSVSVVGRDALAMPSEDIEIALKALTEDVNYMGRTDSRGATFRVRGVDGTPDLMPLYKGQYAAAYIPGSDGSTSTLLLADLLDIERIEVLRGPQGTLFGRNAAAGAIILNAMPSVEGCAGLDFEVDLDAETLTASPGWCEEPFLMKVDCPTVASVGETVQFNAVVSEPIGARINWGLSSGLSLSAEYRDDPDLYIDWGQTVGTSYTFDRVGRFDVGVTATNDYGTDTFTCPVIVEEEEPDSEPEVRIALGYNFEFGSGTGRIGGTAPAPVDLPIYGDVSLGYFANGGQSYGSLNLEVAYRTDLTEEVSAVAGGGVHFLRSGSTGRSDLEIGPGVSGRIHYDGNWPVEPIVELNVAYHYDKLIPTLSLGAAYRFKK